MAGRCAYAGGIFDMLWVMPTRTGAPGELVTIRDVELTRTGRWATSTGVFDFTREDFTAAMAAALDPEVWEAPVKIGHTDPRFGSDDASMESMDGDPALGWVENLRIRDDGPGRSTLIGDLVDVPAALASIIPKAYKRRSIELAFGVRTPSGRSYKAAVVGLALLGVQAPAVAGLADVLKMYAGDSTFQIAAAAADSTHAVLFTDDSLEDRVARLEAGIHSPPASSRHTRADDPQPSPGGSPVPLTTDRIAEIQAMLAKGDDAAALEALRADATPPAAPVAPAAPAAPAPVAPAAPVAGDPAVPPVAPVAPAPVAPVAGDPAPAPAPVAAEPTPVPVAAAVPVGFTVVDTATATRMTELLETERVRTREQHLASAARAGRIAPTAVATWREALDRDPVGNVALLAAQPGVFPTFELGHAEGVAAASSPDGVADADWDAFYAELGAN